MSLLIKDLVIDDVSLRETEKGTKINATYSLKNDKGRVVATKTVSSQSEYQTEPFVPSGPTLKIFQQAVDAFNKELRDSLGFSE